MLYEVITLDMPFLEDDLDDNHELIQGFLPLLEDSILDDDVLAPVFAPDPAWGCIEIAAGVNQTELDGPRLPGFTSNGA